MKLTPQQEQLYAALSGLDEQYVAEALTSGKRSALPILYRVSALAALLALVIGIFALFPSSDSQPFFVSTVHADQNGNVITLSAIRIQEDTPIDKEVQAFLTETWPNFDLFCISVQMDGADADYLANSFATVEYDDKILTSDCQTDHFAVYFPEDPTDNVLCMIYGWAEDLSIGKLNFTVNVLHTEDNSQELLYTMPLSVYYYNNKLGVNGNYSKNNTSISICTNLLSTEELVNSILNARGKDRPMYALSSGDPYDSYREAVDYFDHVLAVLDTRDDATEIMLQKMTEYNNLPYEIIRTDMVHYHITYRTIHLILEYRYFDRLTPDQQAWLESDSREFYKHFME